MTTNPPATVRTLSSAGLSERTLGGHRRGDETAPHRTWFLWSRQNALSHASTRYRAPSSLRPSRGLVAGAAARHHRRRYRARSAHGAPTRLFDVVPLCRTPLVTEPATRATPAQSILRAPATNHRNGVRPDAVTSVRAAPTSWRATPLPVPRHCRDVRTVVRRRMPNRHRVRPREGCDGPPRGIATLAVTRAQAVRRRRR